MLSDVKKKYVENLLNKKGINSKTRSCVMQYIDINQQLFGEFLNIDSVIKRVVENLDNSIVYKPNSLMKIHIFSRLNGNWDAKGKEIYINPILRFKKNGKARLNSVIRHEIDHCATTVYKDISNKQKVDLINEFIKKNHIKSKKVVKRLEKDVDKYFIVGTTKVPISGITDRREIAVNNLDLKSLNEGITAYKQDLYDRFLGYKKTYAHYANERKVVEGIVRVIGKERLITSHFNNDYGSIKKAFREETGRNLDDLVIKLNEQPKMKKTNFLIRINPLTRPIYWYRNYKNKMRSKKYSEELESYIQVMTTKNKNKKTDFIPKVKVNDEEVLKKIEKDKNRDYKKLSNDRLQKQIR